MDIGGTHLRAGLYALTAGRLERAPSPIASLREKVGDQRSPEALCSRISVILKKLWLSAGLPESDFNVSEIALGIAFAGMMSGHEGHVANSPHFGWRDVPFGKLLRAELGKSSLVILNDVNAATFAEFEINPKSERNDILCLFVGTGIGAGAVCGDQLLLGATNTASELGHVKVAWGEDARLCACGRRGCVEAYAGGVALQSRAQRELADNPSSLVVALAGDISSIHPGHIDQAAAQGDIYAQSLYSEIAPLLGLALANAVTLLNPDMVVLGGGVLDNAPVLKEKALEHFREFVNPPALIGLSIRDARYADSAGMLGAALFALRSSTL
ncbi:MAG: ROK family protein [Kofleriaceae bacterium]|nr:ROK family protein [Kofleriaceae bacterium]